MVSRDKPITKRDLRRIIKRFLADKDRGISMALFADLAGVSLSILKMVFLYETEPMSEYVQRRVTKAYLEFRDGEVAIMQNRDNTKFVQYRKEAKPVIQKSTALQLVNGKITIKVGMKNASDYSDLTLDEQFKRG
jgi:AraC-like DNA-binding protein